ncbi:MAG: ComF family protein [Candidatus Limivivens sp.]|nr:ComF family protein [Candidatus Limivivens sp.]
MKFFLNLFYPAKCPFCGDILKKERLICEQCEKNVKPLQGPKCKKCGKILGQKEREYCLDCSRTKHAYARGTAVYPYSGAVRRAVWRFKYQNRRCYARAFAEMMWETSGEQLKSWKPDLVIPVPLHPKRKKKRGYNQAFLLAEPIAGHLGIPVLENGLLRVTPTSPQKNLDRKKRQINLKRAFKIGKDDVKLKRILLVDDIYTTGSTIDAAAEILLEQGAAEVFFLALCIGEGE